MKPLKRFLKIQRKPCFEGFYLKHVSGERTVAFIPAFHRDEKGQCSASVQVITHRGSWYIPFSMEGCRMDSKGFFVKIGGNVFSSRGISVHLETEGLSLVGELRYGPLTPLKSDIMGPFAYLPFMQCRHGIVSLTHSLSGFLVLNGEVLSFLGGRGYIEKDRGTSFPRSYLWTQLNWTHGRHNCSLMLSVADIPLRGFRFTGCICAVYYDKIHYRLATYLGAKILTCTEREVVVRQRCYLLKIRLLKDDPRPLKAPESGRMVRTIHESASCTVRCRFYKGPELLFDVISSRAGFEAVGFSPADSDGAGFRFISK